MRIRNIKINNLKSLGEDDNILHLSNGITTLIGKNESGKTNILLGASYLKMNTAMPNHAFANVNKASLNPISYIMKLEYTDEDMDRFKVQQEVTTIIFKSNDNIEVYGGFSTLINSTEFMKNKDYYLSTENFSKLFTNVKTSDNLTNAKSIQGNLYSMTNKLKYN